MGLFKCCVSGCTSTSDSDRLLCLPKNDNLRNLWLSFLEPTNPQLHGLTKDQLLLKRVCSKHFDKHQFANDGKRLQLAYPCLFTADEIEHGVPLYTGEYCVLGEHNYANQEDMADETESSLFIAIAEASEALHRFPNPDKDPDRFRTWLYAIGHIDILALDNLHIFKNRRICHLHFETQYHTRHKRISCNAIPTLQLPGPVTNVAKKRVIKEEADAKEDKYKKIDIIKHDSDTDNTKVTVDYEYLVEANVDQEMYDGIPDVKRPKEEGPFSWQKFNEEVVPLDEKPCTDDVTYVGESQLVPELCDPEEIQTQGEFSCNVCNKPIIGFRYACVQCCDWDLCGACEARGEHAIHFVLRVPPHKTRKETQTVLAALRQMLEGRAVLENPNVAVIKDEVNTEDPLRAEPAPAAPADSGAARASAGAHTHPPGLSDDEMYEVEYLETASEPSISLDEDITEFVPTDSVFATPQKRKLFDACRSYTNRRKAQKHDERSLKVPKLIPTKVYSAPKIKHFASVAPQIEINNVIFLDVDADKNTIVASHADTSDVIALHKETGSVTATSKLKQNKKLIATPTEKNVMFLQLDADTNSVVAPHAETSDLIALRKETGAKSKLKRNKKLIATQTGMEPRGGKR